MNSGDWIENLTALEYQDSKWRIYSYNEDPVARTIDIGKKKQGKESAKALMASLMLEMNMKPGQMKEVQELDEEGEEAEAA